MLIGSHETHEIADAFPLMLEHRLSSLVEDLKTHGLRHPIVLYEGKILDGRNRYLACIAARIEPRFEDYQGDNPLLFAWSENGERRDLTDGQRAIVARRLATLRRRLSKKLRTSKVQRSLDVDPEAANHVSDVRASGVPELVTAMEQGDMTAADAAEVCRLPEGDQRRVLQGADTPARAPRVAAAAPQAFSGKPLDPVEIAAIKAGLLSWENSVHGILNAAARAIRERAPWL
jgi:hypothetical protein